MLKKGLSTNDADNLPELKLNMTRESENEKNGLHLNVNAEQAFTEPWCELKVRDKFIDKRSCHAACVYNDKLYVYGGSDLNQGIFHDFNYIEINEEFTLSHWKPVKTKTKANPGPRSRSATILVGDNWYLYGGCINATENSSDIWCFNFSRMEWTQIKPKGKAPLPVDSHSANHYVDTNGTNYLVSFAGFAGGHKGEYWNRINMYDMTRNEWLDHEKVNSAQKDTQVPQARGGHGSVIHKGQMYVFGGTNGELRFNDIWKYDLRIKQWKKIETRSPPQYRNGHSMTMYKDRGFIVFGGIQDITHEKDDVLLFDFAREDWATLEAESAPSKSPSPTRGGDGQSRTSTAGKNTRRTSSRGLTVNSLSPTKKSAFGRGRSGTQKLKPKPLETQNSSNKQGVSPSGNHSPTGSIGANSFFGSQSEQRSPTKTQNALELANKEKRMKIFQQKKNLLLKQFEVTDPTKKQELQKTSPTTASMKNSIVALNYKRDQNQTQQTQQQATSIQFNTQKSESESPTRVSSKRKQRPTPLFDFLGGFNKFQVPVDGKLAGHKPCARDGHSAILYRDKLLIFGGDRHKMAFNDIHIMNIDVMMTQSPK